MKKLIYFLPIIMIFLACEKNEDLGESNIKVETTERNEIDQWIYDNFTVPYNVEVKYKWDDYEVENSKVLGPPEMHMVIPFLKGLKKVWIDTYVAEGGVDFMRKMIPKQIVLVGTKNYNSSGTITQGTAEGGRKVVLYQINEFDKKNTKQLKRLFHVMHHEFGHILHQEVLYPNAYKEITPGGYTAAWVNVKEEDARNEGFISPYAKNIIDDDWVEMIAFMLTNSNDEWNALVESASKNGQVILRNKEMYVVDYFERVWNIDLYALQERIDNVIKEYQK